MSHQTERGKIYVRSRRSVARGDGEQKYGFPIDRLYFGLTVIEIADDDGGTLLGEEKSGGTTNTLTKSIIYSMELRISVSRTSRVRVYARGRVVIVYRSILREHIPGTGDDGNLAGQETGGVRGTAGEVVHDDRDTVSGNGGHCESVFVEMREGRVMS